MYNNDLSIGYSAIKQTTVNVDRNYKCCWAKMNAAVYKRCSALFLMHAISDDNDDDEGSL